MRTNEYFWKVCDLFLITSIVLVIFRTGVILISYTLVDVIVYKNNVSRFIEGNPNMVNIINHPTLYGTIAAILPIMLEFAIVPFILIMGINMILRWGFNTKYNIAGAILLTIWIPILVFASYYTGQDFWHDLNILIGVIGGC